MKLRVGLLLCFLSVDLYAPHAAAPATKGLPVVGILTLSAAPDEGIIETFRAGLRQLGYVDGHNLRIEHKNADGLPERLPRLAKELVEHRVDVVVAGGGPQAQAMVSATSTIPIVVLVHEADPTTSRLIESYRHPGTNVTGVYALEPELAGKRLELLKESVPNIAHVAVLWNAYSRFQLTQLEDAARSLGVTLSAIELNAPYDFDAGFREAKKRQATAAMVLLAPAFYVRRERLAASALRARMPTMHEKEDMVRAGGLLSYGASFDDTWGRAAYFVDRILKGAKASELPVEQVARFKLTVNLKTAKALGLTLPESLLIRADEVVR